MPTTLSTRVRTAFHRSDYAMDGLSTDERHNHVDKLCMTANKLAKPLFSNRVMQLHIF